MAGISAAERKSLAEVKSKFESHEMDATAAAAAEALRKAFQKLAVEIQKGCPDGRNKSLALTHLEDSSMRAIRALSHDTWDAKADESPAPAPAATVPAKAARSPRPIGPDGQPIKRPVGRPRKRVAEEDPAA